MITVIAGKINNQNATYYWLAKTEAKDVGDYAIVENGQSFDLVKIIGVTYTTPEYVSELSKTKFEKMKKVIRFIRKEELESEN